MLLIYVLIIYLCNFLIDSKEIFDVQADELMDSILKNVYSGRFQQSKPIYKSTTQKSNNDFTLKSYLSTKIIQFGATKHPSLKKYAENMTIEDFSLRKRKIDLKVLMESDVKHIPNFNAKYDEIEIQTRRFEKLHETQKPEKILRQVYFYDEDGRFIYVQKNRTISLMAQFVYETRYKLPHAQLLKKKYITNTRYRIGYCFALLRTLKQQQMVIYSTMKNYLEKMLTLYTHIKLYEKVVKLNVDIKDLINYIKHLDKVRQRELVAKTSKSTKN
ncbi:unnamed protein product [Euphydryas editha]|uniref:Uncharacterized protein n=1 Tax=Euphydryas editha TaxID=104508 RepID=A0AAU9U1Y4_EUPED|nr:unnamed protein product [Euphydryas editha]